MTQAHPAPKPCTSPCRRIRRLRRHGLAVLAAATLITGCANVPELDEGMEDWVRDADYPQLQPLDGLQTGVPLPAQQAADLEQQMVARRNRLQARARALNAPIVDDASEARMQAGVAEPGAPQSGTDQTDASQ